MKIAFIEIAANSHINASNTNFVNGNYPVDTEYKLNVHKTFRRRPERLLNVLCTFNLRPVSTGYYKIRSVDVYLSFRQFILRVLPFTSSQ